MAPLEPVHWQVVTPTMHDLLRFIGQQSFADRFYLAGGTAVEQVALASVVDIGLMKLDALISRGSRKDFYDLYFIAQQKSILSLLALGETKYPYARDFELMAVESLVFFENADRDIQPTMLVDVAWEDVRQFFINQAQELGQIWFGADNAETES